MQWKPIAIAVDKDEDVVGPNVIVWNRITDGRVRLVIKSEASQNSSVISLKGRVAQHLPPEFRCPKSKWYEVDTLLKKLAG